MNRWVFDLGNSRLKCAPVHDDGSLGEVIPLAHGEEGFIPALLDMLPRQAESACLASVASSAISATVIDALTTRFRSISIARSVAQLAGVRIAYADPSRLGVDRFLALLAAHARGPGHVLIAGVGTALTLDLLDAHGLHHGGRIAPSPDLMRQALHAAAAQLPMQGGTYHEFATETPDALASGCEGAALGLIERSLQQATQLLGEAPTLLLHGGGAPGLAWSLPQAVYAPALVLEGVAMWSRAGMATA